MLLKDYQSKKQSKKWARQLELASLEQVDLPKSEVEELLLIMVEAYQQCDDNTLKNGLKVLAHCRSSAPIICPVFLSALLWRPNWGDYYDPKLWREDVTSALKTLLNTELRLLSLSKVSGTESIVNQFQTIMNAPLLLVEPIQVQQINESHYLKLVSALLIALFEPLDELCNVAIDIEKIVTKIEHIDHRLMTLTNEFESFESTEAIDIIKDIRLSYNTIDL